MTVKDNRLQYTRWGHSSTPQGGINAHGLDFPEAVKLGEDLSSSSPPLVNVCAHVMLPTSLWDSFMHQGTREESEGRHANTLNGEETGNFFSEPDKFQAQREQSIFSWSKLMQTSTSVLLKPSAAVTECSLQQLSPQSCIRAGDGLSSLPASHHQ